MQGKEIEIKGWPAVAILAVFVLIGGFRYCSTSSEISPQARESIQTYLDARYAAHFLDDPEFLANPDEMAEELLAGVDIVDIKVKGRKEKIVRVEIAVNGQAPPDGESIKYFRVTDSMMMGEVFEGEVTSFSWHLKLF